MYLLFYILGAMMAQASLEPCAGSLVRTPTSTRIDTRRGPVRLRTGDVLEVGYDDGRVENVVVRVSRHHAYFPRLVEGVETESRLDDEWLDRILHVRVVGRVEIPFPRAFYATWPPAS